MREAHIAMRKHYIAFAVRKYIASCKRYIAKESLTGRDMSYGRDIPIGAICHFVTRKEQRGAVSFEAAPAVIFTGR